MERALEAFRLSFFEVRFGETLQSCFATSARFSACKATGLLVVIHLFIVARVDGAAGGTRTPTPKAPEPKSGASTNFATAA